MVKWKELSRLPKSTAYTSLLWRLQTQGSSNSVLQPNWRPSPNKPGEQYVEPDHPATRASQMSFPRVRANGLEIRLVPQACLRRPEIVFPFQRAYITWEKRVDWLREQGYTTKWVARPEARPDSSRNSAQMNAAKPSLSRLPALVDKDGNLVGANKSSPPIQLYPPLDWKTHTFPARRTEPRGGVRKMTLKRLEHRVPMSLMTAMSKDRMGSKRYMRQRLVKKIKICLGLIISKGAYSEDVVEDRSIKTMDRPEKGKVKGTSTKQEKAIEVQPKDAVAKPILFNEKEAEVMGRKWIMQGWTYLIFPTTSLYMMPYSKLITILRDNLKVLYARGVMLENNWLSWALLPGGDEKNGFREDHKRDNLKAGTPKRIMRNLDKQNSSNSARADITKLPDESKVIDDSVPRNSTSIRKARSRHVGLKKAKLSSPFPGFDNEAWHADIEAGLKALRKYRRSASQM